MEEVDERNFQKFRLMELFSDRTVQASTAQHEKVN